MPYPYPFLLKKLDNLGYHPFITFYHGEKSYNALIDCGASHSFLSHELFEGVSEENTAILFAGMDCGFSIWATTPNRVILSEIKLDNTMLLKTDLSHINQPLSALGFTPVDGILGCDLLQRLEAKIDFENRQLCFHNTEISHPLLLEGDSFLTISLTLNNKPLRLLLDTGASQTLLDLHVADMLFPPFFTIWKINDGPTTGISPDDIVNANRSMSITFDNICADDVPRWELCFIALKMNKINHAYQLVGAPPIDAILGIDFLRMFCESVDFKSDMVVWKFP